MATPDIDSAVLNTRVFNDYPGSTLTTVNNYPSVVSFSDSGVGGGGFANRHNFRLSDNGGISSAVFLNGDGFVFESDVTITGPGPTEAGLQVSPWWSQNVDGQFNIRINDGEVACFGGRMPFYSFTANHGVLYVAGTTIHQKMIYTPNGLSEANPATMEYVYTDSTGTYTSGPLAFNEGNPAEDPPYGLWGILNDARVGGFVQIMNGGTPRDGGAIFGNMSFVPEPASLTLLGLALIPALRRRR
jgi:hypothetical protein